MKCSIPEISWHNREPVLSVDIFASGRGEFYRLATGGSDTLILIWQLKIIETGAVGIDILSELTRHQKAVNVVRWSPNGDFLASGDDDANIIVWQLKTDNIPLLEGDNNNKETWVVHKILRCHKEDVYDLCWSPNGAKLLSGSVDNTAILWDLNKGKSENVLNDHKGFVQGVAWDPRNDYIATLSSDRTCRLFHASGKQVRARISRGVLPVEENHNLHNKEVKYFHDDTFKTFFRRLNFSPDGNLLLVPSGCVETEDCKTAMYTTYIFTLDSLKQPAIILPTATQCSIVVRCSPVLYELRPRGPKPYINLPYRMIIAVATDSDVILYDTQQLSPFAHMQNIHYTRLTDLAWSQDGLLLAVSSTDGFITLVTFEDQELGVVHKKEDSETEEAEKAIVEEPAVEEKVKQKRSSFIEQWAKKGPKRKAEDEPVIEAKKIKNDEVIVVPDLPVKTPRKRITPITLKAVTPKKVKSNEMEIVDDSERGKKEEHSDTKEIKIIDDNNSNSREQPKTRKRAQLITLRLGSSNKEKSVKASNSKDGSKQCISKNTMDVDEDDSSDTKETGNGAENVTKTKETVEAEKNENLSRLKDLKKVMKDETNKPKKRAQLIKIGECSKPKKSPAPKETKSGLQSSLIAKLKFALNKPLADKEEGNVEKQNLETVEIDDDVSENPKGDETMMEKHLDTAETTKKDKKGSSKFEKVITAKDISSELSFEKEISKTETKVSDKEVKTNAPVSEKSSVKNISNEISKKNASSVSEESDEGDKANDKTSKKTQVSKISIEEETTNKNNITEDKKEIIETTDKENASQAEEIIDLDNHKSPSTGKKTPKHANIFKDEGAKIKKNTDENKTSQESKIIDLDNYKPPIKSPFQNKKIVTPKRTPGGSKKTPKAEDKISPGRNKKKLSATSLLNFFKPISSDSKTKTEPNEDKDKTKMKPTALFKSNKTGDKDEVMIIDDSNSGDGVGVFKVKTSTLFKSK